MAFAVVNWYAGGQSIVDGIPRSVLAFGTGTWLWVPRPFVVLVAAALLVGAVLGHTRYGRSLYAIGSNREAAYLVGIPVRTYVFTAFAASGALSGAAGVLLLTYSGNANPQVGPSLTLTAVAAAFVGTTAFRLGHANVAGTLVAIYLIAVNVTGLEFAGAAVYVEGLFTGAALVLAIGVSTLLSRRRRRSRRPPGVSSNDTEVAAMAPVDSSKNTETVRILTEDA
jgi:ribose transport system permease protein